MRLVLDVPTTQSDPSIGSLLLKWTIADSYGVHECTRELVENSEQTFMPYVKGATTGPKRGFQKRSVVGWRQAGGRGIEVVVPHGRRGRPAEVAQPGGTSQHVDWSQGTSGHSNVVSDVFFAVKVENMVGRRRGRS